MNHALRAMNETSSPQAFLNLSQQELQNFLAHRIVQQHQQHLLVQQLPQQQGTGGRGEGGNNNSMIPRLQQQGTPLLSVSQGTAAATTAAVIVGGNGASFSVSSGSRMQQNAQVTNTFPFGSGLQNRPPPASAPSTPPQ